MRWYWACQGGDNLRGCFHADYDGRCNAQSHKGFSTRQAAEKAGRKHELKCAFKRFGNNKTHVFQR